MSDHEHITDEAPPSAAPATAGPAQAPRPGPGRPDGPPKEGKAPDVDPELLEDYADFKAWRAARAEAEAVVPAGSAEVAQGYAGSDTRQIKVLEVPIPGGGPGGEERVEQYHLVDIDRDVLAHLSMLTTLADTDMDKAQALFEAMLLPADYVRLRRDVKVAARNIRNAAIADPNAEVLSIEQLWGAIADAVAEPLRELSADPKRVALLRGPSPTGPSSRNGSTPVGLPSSS